MSIDKKWIKSYNSTRISRVNKRIICHAPFQSINFTQNGDATVCCYNRKHVLGRYPSDNLKRIWFGKEAQQLREYIKKNDLSKGCETCAMQIESNNFASVHARHFDFQSDHPIKHFLKKIKSYFKTKHFIAYPRVIEFELSNTCNLECVMCSGEFSSSIRKNRENKPALEEVYDEAFVKQLEVFIPYLDEVKFYGGEPFLIPVYYEIWEKIALLNPTCRISVQTNATTLNNKVKNCLENGNFHLNISLDSLVKENFEHIRKNANFERVMDNLKYFHSYTKSKSTFFGISTCVMRDNWKELPDFIRFCNQLEVPIYFHTVYFPSVRALWNLDSDQLEEISLFLSKESFPSGSEIQRKNKIHFEDTLKLIQQWQTEAKRIEDLLASFVPNIESNEPLQKLYFRFSKSINEKIDFDEAQREKHFQNIFKKMTQLISLLPENYPIETIFSQLDEIGVEQCMEALHINNEEILVNQLLHLSDEN
jgi:MoaA/NifB/PqqE/SkfB family radical SAM enzyme